MNPQQELENRKVDHLILLVGGNPLPNLVVGKLPIGGAYPRLISLIHSPTTHAIAERLQKMLTSSQNDVQLFGEDKSTRLEFETAFEATPHKIRQAIQAAVSYGLEQGYKKVSLNYTGGTKAMAVHAYRALYDSGIASVTTYSPSYLDARTHNLIYENGANQFVGDALDVSLDKLMTLHNWRPESNLQRLTTASLLNVAEKLVDGYCDLEEEYNLHFATVWRDWLKFLQHGNRYHRQPALGRNHRWKREDKLRGKSLQLTLHPRRFDSRKAPHDMDEAMWDQQETARANKIDPVFAEFGVSEIELNDVMRAYGFPSRVDFLEWLDGKWLEHYVLNCLLQLEEALELHSVYANVRASQNDVDFELDVVAMSGYQLFVLSCTTANPLGSRASMKNKLFEAHLRARQLGGDEARAALVCFHRDPERLEKEAYQTLLGDRVRVFGRSHLLNNQLIGQLYGWIDSQKGEK